MLFIAMGLLAFSGSLRLRSGQALRLARRGGLTQDDKVVFLYLFLI